MGDECPSIGLDAPSVPGIVRHHCERSGATEIDKAAGDGQGWEQAWRLCPYIELDIPGAVQAPLAGLTFAAKDLFDVAGHTTGSGNPTWLATHPPATETAPAVKALLNAGARLISKTITDELAFSINSEGGHYGTPLNTKGAAGHGFPAVASSGSASAVAGGAVPLALEGVPAVPCRIRPRSAGLQLPPDPWPHSAGWRNAAGAQLRRGRLEAAVDADLLERVSSCWGFKVMGKCRRAA